MNIIAADEFRPSKGLGTTSTDIQGNWLYLPQESIVKISGDWTDPFTEDKLARDEDDEIIGFPRMTLTIKATEVFDPVAQEWVTGNITIFSGNSFTQMKDGKKDYTLNDPVASGDYSINIADYSHSEHSGNILVRGQLSAGFYASSGDIAVPISDDARQWTSGGWAYWEFHTVALNLSISIPEFNTDGSTNTAPWAMDGNNLPHPYQFDMDTSQYVSHPYAVLPAWKFDKEYPYTWDIWDDDYLGDRVYVKLADGLHRVGEYIKTETGLKKIYSKVKKR